MSQLKELECTRGSIASVAIKAQKFLQARVLEEVLKFDSTVLPESFKLVQDVYDDFWQEVVFALKVNAMLSRYTYDNSIADFELTEDEIASTVNARILAVLPDLLESLRDAVRLDERELRPRMQAIMLGMYRLTLQDITESKRELGVTNYPIEIEEVDCSDSIATGFRQSWVEASGEDVEVELASGAGCGSPWMYIRVKESGKPLRYFRSDMRKFLEQFIDKVLN